MTEARDALAMVTVVYRPEVSLLQLQARSLAHFLDGDGVGPIVILVNDDAPDETIAEIEDRVLPEYGALRSRVSIMTAQEFPGTVHPTNGWRRQQSLKLQVAGALGADRLVILDSKNHFIKPVNTLNFVGPDRRPHTFRAQFRRASLGAYFRNSLSYFGIDPELHIESAMPATTPYVLHREHVVAMMDSIAEREHCSFPDFFHTPRRDVTEFFLYFGYLLTLPTPVEDLYHFGPRTSVTLFTRFPNTEEQLRDTLSKVDRPSIVMFGLHKNRVLSVNEHVAGAICELWVRVGLFSDTEEARSFFASLRRSVEVAEAN